MKTYYWKNKDSTWSGRIENKAFVQGENEREIKKLLKEAAKDLKTQIHDNYIHIKHFTGE